MIAKSANPFIAPCLPTLRDRSPTGADWLHEVKLDGFRTQIHKVGKRVTLFSRNGHDHSDRYPFLIAALAQLPARSAILDGELVAHNAKGQPDFHKLLRRQADAETTCIYAFDLLHINGKDLRALPLMVRKERLASLIERAQLSCLLLSETFDNAETLLNACNERGLEGVVSKRKQSPYRSGKSTAWIKVKCAAWRAANRERYKIFQR